MAVIKHKTNIIKVITVRSMVMNENTGIMIMRATKNISTISMCAAVECVYLKSTHASKIRRLCYLTAC